MIDSIQTFDRPDEIWQRGGDWIDNIRYDPPSAKGFSRCTQTRRSTRSSPFPFHVRSRYYFRTKRRVNNLRLPRHGTATARRLYILPRPAAPAGRRRGLAGCRGRARDGGGDSRAERGPCPPAINIVQGDAQPLMRPVALRQQVGQHPVVCTVYGTDRYGRALGIGQGATGTDLNGNTTERSY